MLCDATDQLGMGGFNRAMKVLAVLLGLQLPKVEACLASNRPLIRAGLLEVRSNPHASIALSSMSLCHLGLFTFGQLDDQIRIVVKHRRCRTFTIDLPYATGERQQHQGVF